MIGSVIVSAALALVIAISLIVGKTPYLGFFRRNFIARRKWDPGHYWAMLAQYAAVAIIFLLVGWFSRA